MKKRTLLLIVISILLIIIVIALAIFARRIMILNNFFKARLNMFTLENYKLTTNKEGNTYQISFKSGDYVETDREGNTEKIWYFANGKQLIFTKNYDTKSATVNEVPTKPNRTLFPQSYYSIYNSENSKIQFKTLFDYAIKLKITTDNYNDENVYILQNDEIKTIVRKEDYQTLEETYNGKTITYTWELDTVTDEDLKEPNISQFQQNTNL